MKLAVISYPELHEAARNWIESVRLRHDPQARRLRVHFTLVFPFEGEPAPLSEEIEQAARGTQPIAFEISEVQVIPDALSSQSHVFLVPNQGYKALIALHERLYSHSLGTHKRRDIPYIPHLTVAQHPTVRSAEALAQTLRLQMAEHQVVTGVLSAIDLVDLSSDAVSTIAQSRLTSPAVTDAIRHPL